MGSTDMIGAIATKRIFGLDLLKLISFRSNHYSLTSIAPTPEIWSSTEFQKNEHIIAILYRN